jgi:hypothetical protein
MADLLLSLTPTGCLHHPVVLYTGFESPKARTLSATRRLRSHSSSVNTKPCAVTLALLDTGDVPKSESCSARAHGHGIFIAGQQRQSQSPACALNTAARRAVTDSTVPSLNNDIKRPLSAAAARSTQRSENATQRSAPRESATARGSV